MVSGIFIENRNHFYFLDVWLSVAKGISRKKVLVVSFQIYSQNYYCHSVIPTLSTNIVAQSSQFRHIIGAILHFKKALNAGSKCSACEGSNKRSYSS